MLAAFVAPAALYFHAYWRLEDAAQRQTRSMFFWRNVGIFAAPDDVRLFASVGAGLRYSVTDALVDLD